MSRISHYLILVAGIAVSFFAQLPPGLTHKTGQRVYNESPSKVSLTSNGGEKALEINNVTYEVTGDSLPGRPQGERLLLRQTNSSKQVLGEVGQDATTALEAWPLGTDLNHKPLYNLKVSGSGGSIVDGQLFVANRRLEEVEWWSVYRLGTGQHLFDTHVPLVTFSVGQDAVEPRYIGLEIPEDGSLKSLNLVAVISYASAEQVKNDFLLTCDDVDRASQLRSYSDTSRTISVSASSTLQGDMLPLEVRIAFRDNHSQELAGFSIPIAADDLDFAHAQLPSGLHLAPCRREAARR